MKIIVGLGNPGSEYKKTRHNVGFMMIDKMAKGEKFSLNKKFEAEILEINGWILVKPQTYMNDSGRAIRKILDFYKLEPSELVLVHDDLDFELGLWKIQMGVGPKIHNGVNSVEQYLGTKDFLRVRVGIDNRKNRPTSLSGADYVLENFGKEESEKIEKILDDVIAQLLITLSL